MEKDRTIKWIIVLLIINLIAVLNMSIGLSSKLSDLREDIHDMEYDIERKISYLEGSIINQVELTLDKQNNPVQKISYETSGFNVNDLTAEIELTVQFKNIDPESEIHWLYVDDFGVDKSVILKPVGNLTYIGKSDLSIQNNYQAKLVEVQNDIAIRQLNLEPIDLELKSEYYENRVKFLESSGSSGGHTFDKESIFEIKIIDEEHFGLEKVEMILLVDGNTINITDVTDTMIMGDNLGNLKMEVYQSDTYTGYDRSKHYSVSVTNESSESISSTDTDIFNTSYLMHYFYGSYVDYEGVTEDDYIEFRYRFTYKDGYVEEE